MTAAAVYIPSPPGVDFRGLHEALAAVTGEFHNPSLPENLHTALPPASTDEGVLFTFDGSWAKDVYIAGDFNGWDQTANPMTRNENGIWWAVIPLSSGTQQYKFVVDGNWEVDPLNPYTTGEYGNSAITIRDDGTVMPIPEIDAPPLNPNIAFHGDFRSWLHSELKENEPFRMEDAFHDVKLDLDSSLDENIALWARLRLQSEEERAFLERLDFRMSNPYIALQAFYDIFGSREIDLGDPYGLTANFGEFHDAYGRDAQGLHLRNGDLAYGIGGSLLYGNDIDSGEDLAAVRIFVPFRGTEVGFLYRRISGFDTQYSSPRSAGGDYGLSELAGFDISLPPFLAALLRTEILIGREVVRDQAGTSWDYAHRLISCGVLQQLLAKGLRLSLRCTWEKMRYATHAGGHDADMMLGELVLDRLGSENAPVRMTFRSEIRTFFMENSFPWIYLWDFEEMDRQEINEYIAAGYRNKLRISSTVRTSLDLGIDWLLRYHPALDIVPSAGGPVALEQVVNLDMSWKSFALLNDIRIASYRSNYLELEETYISSYHAIEYSLSRNATVRLGYGLRPEDLDDEPRVRARQLHSYGLTLDTVKTNYNNLGASIAEAEEKLSRYSGLSLEGRFLF
jgi:hypothetical protein